MSGLWRSFLQFFQLSLPLWPWNTSIAGMLGTAGLAAAFLAPFAILLLYFLKLRRKPIEVPSTYLWSKTIEDLHVNDIWQRLRRNLLLLLQLILVALVLLSLFKPGWRSRELEGGRHIFLLDTSASMSAIDREPSRLEEAKVKIRELIERMPDADSAMVVSFSDTVRVEQSFTPNKRLLLTRLNGVEPTNRTSELSEALRTAAGLANPGRSSDKENAQDVQVADAINAVMHIFSDGGFERVTNFTFGDNLTIEYNRVGDADTDNVGVVAFGTDRNPEDPTALQAYARIENFGPAPVTTEVSLYLNDVLADAQNANVPEAKVEEGKNVPGGVGLEFNLPNEFEGVLRLEIARKDQLAVDNVAHATLNPPRPARVLYVSDLKDDAFRIAITTSELSKISTLKQVTSERYKSKEVADDIATGTYDLAIFNGFAPETPPEANTLFLGVVPPFEGWSAGESVVQPQIIQIDPQHPLTQLVDMSNVVVVEGTLLQPPKGALSLFDEANGPLYAIAPRGSHEDAVLGFGMVRKSDKSGDGWAPNTDWPRRRSFPVFAMNAVKYLGGLGSAVSAMPSVRPGAPQQLRTLFPVDQVTITTPSKKSIVVPREGTAHFTFNQTDEIGVYEVAEGAATGASQKFTVNLFSSRESDLTPSENLGIGNQDVQGKPNQSKRAARNELWKWVLLVALAVLTLEWWVYNKRVYL